MIEHEVNHNHREERDAHYKPNDAAVVEARRWIASWFTYTALDTYLQAFSDARASV